MTKTVILSGGIAGLLCLNLIENSQLISNYIGGQFKCSFSLGPRELHYNKKFYDYLCELMDEKLSTQTIKIGYFYDGELRNKIDNKHRKLYYCKSRLLSETCEVPKSVMTENKNKFKSIDVEFNNLIEKLSTKKEESNRMTISNIRGIDLEDKKVYVDNRVSGIDYDVLINTLPAPLFFNLIGDFETAKKFKSISTTFFKDNQVIYSKYNYVYFPDYTVPFHRVTYFDKYTVLEQAGEQKMYSFDDVCVVKKCQLQQEIEFTMPENTYALGRYAQFKCGIKANHVFDRIQKLQKEL